MRILKITIFAAIVLTCVILFGVGYVWRELAFTSHTIATVDSVAPVATSSVTGTVASTTDTASVKAEKFAGSIPLDSPKSSTSTSTNASVGTPIQEPITVSTSDLPETQRAILDTLGMDGASITITPKMVECAIDSIGAERVDEIQKGDAPSLAEGLTLIACMKK